jgi:hypothetical protein
MGYYRASAVSGTIAAGAAAASEIFQFRVPATFNRSLVTKITLDGMYQLTGFTAGAALFTATVARAWTADGTGGTAATLTGNNNKLRTAYPVPTATLRFPTTAALGAGTKTLDALPFAQYVKFVLGAQNTQVFEPVTLFTADAAGGSHPVVLKAEEGIAIRATVPATGTWVIGCTFEWAGVI